MILYRPTFPIVFTLIILTVVTIFLIELPFISINNAAFAQDRQGAIPWTGRVGARSFDIVMRVDI